MFVIKESSRDMWLLALVVLMSVAANLPEELAERFSVDKKYLLIGLTCVIGISLIRYVRIGLILAVTVLVVGANLPKTMADQFNVDPSVMFFTLVVMVVVALANRIVRLPTGLEPQDTAKSTYGAKALFSAVLKGNVQVVQALIESGVNVNIRTMSGKTPLMAAAYRGYADIVQMLITAGAEVQSKDSQNNTALNVAKRMGFSRVVALLKIAGAKD